MASHLRLDTLDDAYPRLGYLRFDAHAATAAHSARSAIGTTGRVMSLYRKACAAFLLQQDGQRATEDAHICHANRHVLVIRFEGCVAIIVTTHLKLCHSMSCSCGISHGAATDAHRLCPSSAKSKAQRSPLCCQPSSPGTKAANQMSSG